MRRKTEVEKENQEFIKNYDDSKYAKPSVTTDMVMKVIIESIQRKS